MPEDPSLIQKSLRVYTKYSKVKRLNGVKIERIFFRLWNMSITAHKYKITFYNNILLNF